MRHAVQQPGQVAAELGVPRVAVDDVGAGGGLRQAQVGGQRPQRTVVQDVPRRVRGEGQDVEVDERVSSRERYSTCTPAPP